MKKTKRFCAVTLLGFALSLNISAGEMHTGIASSAQFDAATTTSQKTPVSFLTELFLNIIQNVVPIF